MSTKRKCKVVSVPKKRKWLTLEQKLEIIKCHEDGASIAKIARDRKINESSIRTLLKKKDKIKEHGKSTASYMTKVIIKQRSSAIDSMEAMLMIWIKDCNEKQIPLSQMIIQAKATSLYRTIKQREKGTDDSSEKFSASRGWLFNFQKRMRLRNVRIDVKTVNMDNDFDTRIPNELMEVIEKGGCKDEQIFKVDETGVFWKKKPTRTYLLDHCDLSDFEMQNNFLPEVIEKDDGIDPLEIPNVNVKEFLLDDLSTIIKKIDEVSDFLIVADPNIERSIKIRQTIQNAIRCYRDIHTEQTRNKSLESTAFKSHQSFS